MDCIVNSCSLFIKINLLVGISFFIRAILIPAFMFLKRNGLDLFNHLMEILVRLKEYDLVIIIGSNMRIDLADTLLEGKVVGSGGCGWKAKGQGFACDTRNESEVSRPLFRVPCCAHW